MNDPVSHARPARHRAAHLALALALLLGAAPRGAHAAVPVEGLKPLRGPTVRPTVIQFESLPRITTPYTGEIVERPEAINREADEQLEELKRHPADIRPSQLTQLTLDATGTPFQIQAPAVGNGFEGITQGGYIPSEPTVAGGPLNIFTCGNVSVTVTNKDGSNRVETSGQTFFGVTAGEGAISDAQCYYDALRGRFVALTFTQGTSPSNFSNFYLAISQTNDARGSWYRYKFDMTKDGNLATTNWSDYQSLAVSDDKIAFTGQQFRFIDNSYAYQKIRVIDRALAYTGAPVSYVDFTAFNAPSGSQQDVFVTKGARNLSAGDNTIHCLCVRTNGGTNVTYRDLTGPPSSPVLSPGVLIPVSAYSAPPDAPQKGSSGFVVTNDCRPADFYVRNGVLIVAWHTTANVSGTVCAVRLLRLRMSDLTVLTDETYASAGVFYYYPAVTVDSVGTIYLGFDRSSTTEYPSAYATGKRRGDSALQPSVLLKAGLSPTSQSRWGDYTGIDNDASLSGPGGSTAWYAGQWTKTTNSFGTWINRLSYTYGQIAGTVTDDCDGSTGTSGDRGPLSGVTLTLKQGASTLATTLTDAAGAYSFGWLETGTYDVLVTPPGGVALDATAGSGGNAQTRISASDLQVSLTDSQTSTANLFLVTSTHPVPATASISPTSRLVGSGAFTLTINGSNFARCSVAQLDGSPRTTTYVNGGQLTAAIPASDVSITGIHTITVTTTGPGGGTSNGQQFIVNTGTDHTPPSVMVTSPVGGESWAIASTHSITWSATDNILVANVDLDLSTDGGASFPFTIAHAIANSGSYSWNVASLPTTTARVRVRARDADGNLGADSSHTNVTLTGWAITASAGANGTIAPSGAFGVADGATPSFTMTPATGYSVADVLVNGASVGAVTSYTFGPVHANQTIAASFTINRYPLNVVVVGNGSVDKSPDQALYDHGTVVTLTATPTSGSSFQGWHGDATGSANPLVVTMTSAMNDTAVFNLHVYSWNIGSNSFGTASNWTPPRTTPATDDVLLFTQGTTITVSSVTSQTIGRLVVSNGSTVALQSTGSATLTIAGGPGTDLDVGAGSTLRLNGSSALTIALGANATGAVSGTVDIPNGAHRLAALGANALEFQSGSLISLGTTFSGNVFGTGFGTSALNSVVFHSGSIYSQSAGANPFGATSPNSVVTFEHGSRYRLNGASATPDFNGRTYADFEHNANATTTPTAASPFSLDSLIVTRGTLNLNLSAGGTIRGSINVVAGGNLNFNPITGTPVITLAGGTTQTLDLEGTFSTTALPTFAINNPSGVVMLTDWTIAGGLSFTTGRLFTGTNLLSLSGGVITGASQADGYVVGNLRLDFPAGAPTRTFEFGDAVSYSPITVTMNDLTTTFDMTAKTQTPDHPNLATSGLDPARSVNRWWTLTPLVTPSFSSMDATFGFRSLNVDPAADPQTFLVKRYNGGWSSTGLGTRAPSSTQAVGITDFGDFAIADPPTVTLAVTVVGSGSVGRSPDQVYYTPGSSVTLTASPAVGWAFVGWSGDLSGSTNPTSIALPTNKAVTATFVELAPPAVTVTAPNGGGGYVIGTTTSLTWTASGPSSITSVDLLLSRSGSPGPFDPIATGIPNTGSYDWSVAGPTTYAAILEVIAHDAGGHSGADLSDTTFAIVTSLGVAGGPVTEFALSPVSPNPVHGGGLIAYALPRAARVRVSVLDLQGRELRVLVDSEMPAGRHETLLEGGRSGLPAGLYFARLEADGLTRVRRFAVTR